MRALIARYLDPLDALVELIYGVLIIMTFTMAVRSLEHLGDIAIVGANWTQSLLIAALGCAVAWGFIDGVIYVLTCVGERNSSVQVVKRVQAAATDEERIHLLVDAYDDVLDPLVAAEDRKEVYRRSLPLFMASRTERSHVKAEDIKGGIAIFLTALVATLPVAIPLLLVSDAGWSMRIANLLCIIMLFIAGWLWGRMTGGNRLRTGLAIAGVGLLLVAIAIPLGG